MCEPDERVEAALASVTLPQNGVVSTNQTPPAGSRRVVLPSKTHRAPKIRVIDPMDYEGIGFSPRNW